jgi:hypothetical protein
MIEWLYDLPNNPHLNEEASMSKKVFALLAVIVLFVSIVSTRAYNIERDYAGPQQQDIESFYVELNPEEEDTVIVLGENECFVLTDVYCSWSSSGIIELQIKSNSSKRIWLQSPGSSIEYQKSFTSGISFHPGDALLVYSQSPIIIRTTLMGYFLYE